MVVSYEPWIVALSVLVAIQGAYVGLNLALELPASVGLRRRVLLAGAAVTLAVAIWSMHFVGMLAVRAPVRIEYAVLPTLVSFLVCVVVVGFAVFVASLAPHSTLVLALAAVIMGTGIVTMHFIGMMALHANAMMHHDLTYVVASGVVGVGASGLALFFAFGGLVRPPLAAASVALGLAISGMHYMAMTGMRLYPLHGGFATGGTTLSSDLLAVIVAIVAFGSSSAFLLALVPDAAPATFATELWQGDASVPQLAGAAVPAAAGGPPTGLIGDPAPARSEPKAIVIPVQKDGGIHYLPMGRVHAVKAEAHYTTIFDGTDTYFCTLSISDVENRLDQRRFIRVHRSHIVAVDHIASFKRSGDGGIVQLDSPTRYTLPISRRKLSELRAVLHARV